MHAPVCLMSVAYFPLPVLKQTRHCGRCAPLVAGLSMNDTGGRLGLVCPCAVHAGRRSSVACSVSAPHAAQWCAAFDARTPPSPLCAFGLGPFVCPTSDPMLWSSAERACHSVSPHQGTALFSGKAASANKALCAACADSGRPCNFQGMRPPLLRRRPLGRLLGRPQVCLQWANPFGRL